MVAWFLGLEDVLSWLLVDEKCDATTIDINAISLLRQAIGSSPGRNTGTASPESICGNSTGGCCEIEGGDKHFEGKMNELFDELMIAVMDTEQSLTVFDG
ncbi:hypothetical protein Tco_0843147 [Tanacetum coccineum]|uniref:Uncharacterized protein n=1 Tax=Tanacetum coccineum TaxID=301880 RepID=A0ABQ5B184_9ASTR